MELAVENIIKIILGILVVAAIAYGLYSFFSNNFIDTFKNSGATTPVKLFLALY